MQGGSHDPWVLVTERPPELIVDVLHLIGRHQVKPVKRQDGLPPNDFPGNKFKNNSTDTNVE